MTWWRTGSRHHFQTISVRKPQPYKLPLYLRVLCWVLIGGVVALLLTVALFVLRGVV